MGITALCLDLDNSLTLRKGTELTPKAVALIDKAKDAGMQVLILSNVVWGKRRIERVELIAARHDVKCYCARFPWLKPNHRPYREAMKLCGSTPAQTAMVGDQCGTDGRGARKLGIFFIKVKPLGDDHWATRPRRWLEKIAFPVS